VIRVISFRVTDIEHALISADARSKGLSASTYAKTSLFTHINRSPSKGLFAILEQALDGLRGTAQPDPTNLGSDVDTQSASIPPLAGLEQTDEEKV
jgi:hypothetical protein